MINYYNIDQGTDEWFELRKGKLTGSNATAIGANGKGLDTYCRNIALELIGIAKESYKNKDIERGNELESLAISAYEFETGIKVHKTGFITNNLYKNVGVSPDGLIGIDGGCEVKARNNEKHFSLISGDEVEIPKNQIQMTLLITERKWWDFISFNPNFTKPLFIKRIYPDLNYFEKLKSGFIIGNQLITKYVNLYNSYNL